jgi:LPXTG-site transpeptidase (sortase) family protein
MLDPTPRPASVETRDVTFAERRERAGIVVRDTPSPAPRNGAVVNTPVPAPKSLTAGAAASAPARPRPTATATPRQLAPTATTTSPILGHPVTSLVIPKIGLRTDVVLAPLIHDGSDITWQVPSYRVGYAQYTAGAGEDGNTVLIGHVESQSAGSIFHDLDRLGPNDLIQVSSGSSWFAYHVTGSRVVDRRDVSVVLYTPVPTLTLITCAGPWVPAIDDYASRLIVQAVLQH